MKKTERRPGYSAKLLHSRAIYEYNSSGRVVNTDHRFYDSNEYKDQKSSTKRTKIDLTANSEGVKQILDHSIRSDSRSKGNQRLNERYERLHYAGVRHSDRSGKRMLAVPNVSDKRNLGMYESAKELKVINHDRPLAINELGSKEAPHRAKGVKRVDTANAVMKPLRQRPSYQEVVSSIKRNGAEGRFRLGMIEVDLSPQPQPSG